MTKLNPIRLSTIPSKTITWLWDPYIPRGFITLLEGDPGVGKSWLSLDLAARVSTGRQFPTTDKTSSIPGTTNHFPPFGLSGNRVLIITSEDPPSQVIRPRLDMLQADVEKVFVEPGIFILDDAGIISLRKFIEEHHPSLIVIDPIAAILPKGLDAYRQNEVRQALAPLALIADAYNIAVVLVRHWGKTSFSKVQHKGLGSVDFMAIARSAIAVDIDPISHDKIMIHTKTNVGHLGPTLAYTVDDGIEWKGELEDPGLDGLMTNINGAGGGNGKSYLSPLEKCSRFLQDTLLMNGGRMPSNSIKARALDSGFNMYVINRAKKRLHILSIKDGLGEWSWALPQ